MKHFINLQDIPAKDLRKILIEAKKRKTLRKRLNNLDVDPGSPLKGNLLIKKSFLKLEKFELNYEKFIVATDKGIFYQLQKENPNKEFFEAPTAGNGAQCKSCSQCPWMGLNSLENLERTLIDMKNLIEVPNQIALEAQRSLNRMTSF